MTYSGVNIRFIQFRLAHQRFKPKKECLEKYGVPATRSPIYSEFMDTKYRCAIKCTSPTELTVISLVFIEIYHSIYFQI